jgi:uncharacterized caspase-like protein
MLLMTDDSPDSLQPRLKNLRDKVPEFLKKVGEKDTVVLFFSGHGVSQRDETCLVPSDFQRKAAVETGLPARELREALTNCKAKTKSLMHAFDSFPLSIRQGMTFTHCSTICLC